MRLPRRSSKAFTLIEMIVVIVILGILALIAIPTFSKVVTKSQDESTLTTLRAIARDAQALKALDQATAWGTLPEDAIGETSQAAATGALAAGVLAAVVDNQRTNPTAGQVAYLVKGDGVVLSMMSSSQKICVVGFNSTAMGLSTCQTPDPNTTTSVGTALSSGASSVLPSGTATGGGGSTTPTLTPLAATSVRTAGNTTCSLNSGALTCWGSNTQGQLATTATPSSNPTPAIVPAMSSGVTAYTVGSSTVCAVKTGDLYCWGSNNHGALGTGSTDAMVSTPTKVLTGNVTSVSSSGFTVCATQSGSLYCWGNNSNGTIGDNSRTDRPTPFKLSLTSVTLVEVGIYNTCAVAGGRLYCWGNNSSGSVGDNSTTERLTPTLVTGMTSGVTSIAVGYKFTCAVQSGTAKCWGINSDGMRFGNGQAGAGTFLTPQTAANGLTGVASISAGTVSACARIQNGSVKCWGNNASGQLGNDTTASSDTPVDVTGMSSGVTSLSAFNSSACAVQSGLVKCWGYNGSGELGDGTTQQRNAPVTALVAS